MADDAITSQMLLHTHQQIHMAEVGMVTHEPLHVSAFMTQVSFSLAELKILQSSSAHHVT